MMIAASIVSALALLVPANPASLAAISTRLPARPVVMNQCAEGGFNAFRQWPSAARVSLTPSAQSFFGEQSDVTFDQMREKNICEPDVLDKIMNSMPMADQRGEKVLLDVNGEGVLEWITVV